MIAKYIVNKVRAKKQAYHKLTKSDPQQLMFDSVTWSEIAIIVFCIIYLFFKTYL